MSKSSLKNTILIGNEMLQTFIVWKPPQQCLALKTSRCRLHSCGLGWYFAFQCLPFCMGTEGVAHLPTNFPSFKRDCETSSVLCIYKTDGSGIWVKRASWTVCEARISPNPGKWPEASQGFLRGSMFFSLPLFNSTSKRGTPSDEGIWPLLFSRRASSLRRKDREQGEDAPWFHLSAT